MNVTKCLSFSDEDSSVDLQPNMETEKKDTGERRRTFVVDTNETEPASTDSMLKGMTGYEPTRADLEFINKMKEEKLLKHMQEELLEVQKLLKREEMALELACASRDKVRAECDKFPSCEELSEWIKVVLKVSSPPMDLAELDAKALLAMVTEDDVQAAMDTTRIQIKQTERILTNRRKKGAEEKGRLENVIATEQLKIQKMMTQLSDLTSELARQQEVYKALQTQIETSKGDKVEAKGEDTTEDTREGKGQRKPTKKTKEKLPDANKQRKFSRSQRADGKTESQAGKDDTNEAPTTTTTTTTVQTKSRKAAKGQQRKVQEQQESVRAMRGSPKPAETAQTKVKSLDAQSNKLLQAAPPRGRGKAAAAAAAAVAAVAAAAAAPRDDGEEAQSPGPRRSKRIASKR